MKVFNSIFPMCSGMVQTLGLATVYVSRYHLAAMEDNIVSNGASNRKESPKQTSIGEIIERLGRGKVLREKKEEFHQVISRMDKEYPTLMDQYPDKWIAVGKDGVLAVADSMEEVFAEVESRGLSGSEFEVEFLDSNPPDLIL